MKIVFIYQGSEAIGVEALAAYLELHGHETKLVFDVATFSSNRGGDIPALAKFFNTDPRDVAKYALELEPDVLAFSTITGIYKWSLEVASLIRKKKRVPTVFGGIHPTATPEAVIKEDALDAIVMGEGEDALLELVESCEAGAFRRTDVRNAWIKSGGGVIRNPVRPYISDLDSLPFPKKTDFYHYMPVLARHYKIVSSRGCPHKCTYCCNHIFHKLYGPGAQHVRRRSPLNVIAELEGAKERFGFEYVEFWDDIFTKDTAWLEEFAPLYRARVGVPFQCYAHPNFFDAKRAELLARAGCYQLKIGVQSIDDDVLKNTLMRPGRKNKVALAIAAAKEAGMRVNVEHLLDLPGEGPESQSRAAHFYMENRPDKIANFWLVYYPGTTIGRHARDKGILDDNDLEAIESGSDKFLYTFMFPGGKAAERINKIKPFQTLLDMIPWLPKRLIKWLLQNDRAHRLPHSSILHQLLMVFNAIRINEREDLQAIRYSFSRKYKPYDKYRAEK